MTWRYQKGDEDVMRQALRERNEELLEDIMAAAIVTGAPLQEVTDRLLQLFLELDMETRQWWDEKDGPASSMSKLPTPRSGS